MLKIDLHCHTVHSGHAYGTIYDLIREAQEKKMDMIAITDHGPKMDGAATYMHFQMGYRAPKKIGRVEMLWGCEANIIDANGTIDLEPRVIRRLDILLCGLHMGTPYKDLGIRGNTQAIIKSFARYPIHVFTHPTTKYFEYDLDRVMEGADKNNVLLELNLATLSKLDYNKKRDCFDDYSRMVEYARKHKKKLIVNSDTHFISELGEDSILDKYRDKLKLSKELIINEYPDQLRKFLASKDLAGFR